MEHQLSLHLKTFNKRVQVMNQTNAKELILTRLEAQNLHAELFEILAQISDLIEIRQETTDNAVVNVEMDGGGF